MRRLLIPLLTALLTVVALFASLSVAHAQEPAESAPSAPQGSEEIPQDISCIQPVAEQNVCYINARELNWSVFEGKLVVSLTLGLQSDPTEEDDRVLGMYTVWNNSDTALSIPNTQNGMGFQVACGEPATPGSLLGSPYRLTIKTNAGNKFYGYVTCPAYIPGIPTAVGANSFTATLDRLAPYQGYLVALVVGVGLLVNLLVPARLKQWRKRTE